MRRRTWLLLALAVVALLLAANEGVSGALEHGWARRSLLARLAASFGRPVEVGRFEFSLFSGLRLEANSITVAEDPRFGQEYFLRAGQLTASLRWPALLRGRVEFDTLFLSRPSLNLVRGADGRWNIESWLPPASQSTTAGTATRGAPGLPVASGSRIAARLSRIQVQDGRINFKQGAEKLPFALVGVTGHLEEDSAGRWSVDLAADPVRAPIALQSAGTLHLRGNVAGTSARLRPANFTLTWEGASLADAMRLLNGGDHGVRGALAAEFSAAIKNRSGDARSVNAGDAWNIQGTLRLSGVHRWDLAESAADPAVAATIAAAWRPGEPRLELTRCVVEAPHSRLEATGSLDWSQGLIPSLQFASSRIGLADLLAWRRAFLPGVADDLSVDGTVAVDATLAGWPPRLLQAHASSGGAVVRTRALPGAMRIGPVEASLQRGLLVLSATPVSLPGAFVRTAVRGTTAESAPAGGLKVEGSLGPFRAGDWPRDWHYRLAVAGDTERAQDLIALAGALGRPASTEWSVEGSVSLKLAWTGALRRGTSATNGTLELRGLQVTDVVLMNQPLIVHAASVDLKNGEWVVRLAAVQALGSRWTGSLHRRATGGAWDFDLSADRLDAADLDRWLGPRARPSLLDRMMPFGASQISSPDREAAIARLAGKGHFRVAEVALAPLRVEKLDADAEVAGRRVALRRVQADLYGGRITGNFAAQLSAEPSYSFRGRIDRVDVGELADSAASLKGRFAGLGSGEITLGTRGIGRQELTAALEGEGVLRVRNAVVRGIDLAPVTPGNAADAESKEARYSTAAATFHLADGRVRMDQLLLVGRDEQFEAEGSVDFARRLDFRVRSITRDAERTADRSAERSAEFDWQDTESDTWALGGTLDAPRLLPQTPVAGNRIRSAGTRR